MVRTPEELNYDWVVIGSGFGGSVAALRLAERGYSVRVLECGARFEDDDFAKSTSQFWRLLWAPKLGMKGILRATVFDDVLVTSGCGVGGGSLVYANTLYRPPAKVYEDPQWSQLGDWESDLAPHFAEAERMLGVTTYEEEGPQDRLLQELGEDLGLADTYARPPVGVFLGEPGETVPDPYFGGEGPERTGCIRCGSCTIGCPHNAKNTLPKNYLWLAERLGVEISELRTVTDISPLGAPDGSGGYSVTSERSGAWLRNRRETITARGVVVAAGALGTNALLQRCKLGGSLPNVSGRLGKLVRTNSESLLAVTAPPDTVDFSNSVAISSSLHLDEDTHVEICTPGARSDLMTFAFSLPTRAGNRVTRPLHFALNIARHPIRFLRAMNPRRWSRRSVQLLVMQALDNSISLEPRMRLPNGKVLMRTRQDPERPIPDHIPVAYEAAERLAEKVGGTAQATLNEAVLAVPFTGHILGGAPIAADPGSGVVDKDHRVFGYENLLVCDGSAVPANLGVNPSLTITALAEHAMSKVPAKESANAT